MGGCPNQNGGAEGKGKDLAMVGFGMSNAKNKLCQIFAIWSLNVAVLMTFLFRGIFGVFECESDLLIPFPAILHRDTQCQMET